ncbi:MAG TPA: hypothetical protein VGI58_02085 [Streptosporangiaceae bacterium]
MVGQLTSSNWAFGVFPLTDGMLCTDHGELAADAVLLELRATATPVKAMPQVMAASRACELRNRDAILARPNCGNPDMAFTPGNGSGGQ